MWNCVGCQLLLGFWKWGRDIGRVCGMPVEEKSIECLMGKPEKKYCSKNLLIDDRERL